MASVGFEIWHHDLQCPLLPSPLTMLVLSNTERASLRYNMFRFTLLVEKNRKGKRVNKPQNCSKLVIVLRFYLQNRKMHTFRTSKATKMFKYIFVIIVFVYMFCSTWKWFVFSRETWLLAFFCERETVFRIFRDAWKGQLLLREGVFRRGIGDPLGYLQAYSGLPRTTSASGQNGIRTRGPRISNSAL